MRYALLSALLLVGCPSAVVPGDDDDSPTPEPAPAALPSDQPGPYAVGATTIEGLDPDRGKWMVMEVWYPAAPAPDATFEPYPDLNLASDAYRDPAWDLRGAPYPVVAFSHGFGGIRFQSTYLTTWLASHGFVVIAPDHENNTLLDLNINLAAQVASQRPKDVSAAVDIVAGQLEDELDLSGGYAVTGHSFGAWTSLVVGGGLIDLDELIAFCEENDARGCSLFNVEDAAALQDISGAAPDPRARVAVTLSPGLTYSFGADGSGLANNVPTLVQAGTRDSDLPYDSEMRPVFEALPDTARMLTLQDAAHFGFSNLCTSVPVGEECAGSEAGYMDIERVHELSKITATAWIRSHLLGETAEDVFLDAAWVDTEGDATWE